MESRFRILLLSLYGMATLLLTANSFAEEIPLAVEPKIERRDITEAQIDTENIEIGGYMGFISIEDFGVNPVVGARLAFHMTEDFFIEGSYGKSKAGKTSYEKLSGSASLLTDEQRNYTYYNISLGYNVLPGEAFVSQWRAFNNALYLLGGVGRTEFGGDDYFTISYGVGYRLLITDWFAWHVNMRDHMFDNDLLGENKTNHNLEFHTGFTAFF